MTTSLVKLHQWAQLMLWNSRWTRLAISEFRHFRWRPTHIRLAHTPAQQDGSLAATLRATPVSTVGDVVKLDLGIAIDRKGQIEISNKEKAKQKVDLVLILSAVGPNFVPADFTRLVELNADGERQIEGLKKVIPGRDQRLDRASYWILLFNSPHDAAVYQHRLRWYYWNTRLNLPRHPLETALETGQNRGLAVAPPVGYRDPVSGEDVWKRLYEFTLLQPQQEFSVTAMIPPFPEVVTTALFQHDHWLDVIGRPGCWPVRVKVDGLQIQRLNLMRFLRSTGEQRGRKWKIRRNIIGRLERFILWFPVAINTEAIQHEPDEWGDNGWIVRFDSEEEAMMFWRLWHRRVCPSELLGDNEASVSKITIEPLW